MLFQSQCDGISPTQFGLVGGSVRELQILSTDKPVFIVRGPNADAIVYVPAGCESMCSALLAWGGAFVTAGAEQ